jgi:hypothetical protein
MDGSQFQSLAAAGCGQNGISKGFEERLFAFQHIRVVVNAKKDWPLERIMIQGGHGSPVDTLSNMFAQLKLRKCPLLHTFPANTLCTKKPSAHCANGVEVQIMRHFSTALCQCQSNRPRVSSSPKPTAN